MAVSLQIKFPVCCGKGPQVQRGQITGGIVQKHVFAAGIRGVDPAILRAGMPFIDGGIVLNPWISTHPSCPGNFVPEVSRLNRLCDGPIRSPGEGPISIIVQGFEKSVGNPNAVVGVLSRNGLVGLPDPIRVVFVKHEMGESFFGVGEHPLDVSFGHRAFSRGSNGLFQHRILQRIDLYPEFPLTIRDMTGFKDRIESLSTDVGSRDHRRDLLLFDHLPVDKFFNVGMVEVQAHHFCRSPGRPA